VRACLARTNWNQFGAYYYLSRRRLIALNEVEERDGVYYEGDGPLANQPRWTIESASGGRMTGRWSGGGRTLPVRLNRVPATIGEEGPCGSMAFHQPRLEGVRTLTARATVDGIAYSRVTLDHRDRFDLRFETFALDGASEAVRTINAKLAEGLAGNPPSWFQCIQDSLGRSPNEGGFDESLRPVMIGRRWMSVAAHWDGFCGGAHPDSANTWRLFDLTTGGEVEILDWFNATAVKREHLEQVNEDIRTVEQPLRDAILTGWSPEEPDCEELIRRTEFWNVGLARDEMMFSPSLPHVAQACGENFSMPFARLQPFLTPEGAANLRALQGE
jgi:hypothetical protein